MKMITFLTIVVVNLSTYAVNQNVEKELSRCGSRDIWITHVLDTYGTTSNATLELDSEGNPHICYRGSTDPNLIHASFCGSVWNYEIVADSACLTPVMLLDDGDNLHASYFGTPNGGLFYMYKTASLWIKETALPEPIGGTFLSLVLDPDGYPHMCFYDSTDANLKHCWRTASGWQVETIDDEGDSGQYSSMAVNNQGVLHISYCTIVGPSWWNTYLKYAQKDANGWQTEILDVEDAPGFYTSIATDSNGFPHVIYEQDLGSDPLRYFWKDENGWNSELIDLVYDTWTDCNELTLDDNDVPHVCYWDDQHFKYVYRDELGWNIEIIDEFGSNPSIAVDAVGFPHITYLTITGNLVYTKKAPDPTPTPDCFHHGDVNFNGTLTAGDAQLVFWITLGMITPTFQEECAADCDGSGTVSVSDAQMIFDVIFGGTCLDPIS